MDEESRQIIAWLKNQKLSTVIEWGDDCFSEEKPWAYSWVDVMIPNAEELRMHWVWTIVAPDDPDVAENPEAIWQIALPHDLDIHFVYDHESHDYLNEIAVPCGFALTPKQEEVLQKISAESSHCERAMCGGWTPDAVNNALMRWATKYANRPDLIFRRQPDFQSEFAKEARAVLNRIEAGEEKTYDIGDGIVASEGVMDFLLADPDRAAHIMKEFKRVIGNEEK